MALNVLWFGAGAAYFGLGSSRAAKLLVHKDSRSSPLFTTLAASIRFLGGLNLAFAALAALMLFCKGLFPQDVQVAALTSVLALAHGTQFATNLPLAMREATGRASLWPVLRGGMLRIFCIDFALMSANGAAAAYLLLR